MATKKDIELLGVKICQAITQMGREIGKEIRKQLIDISQKFSDISKKIDSNSSSESLSRSKNSNGNTSIHSFPKILQDHIIIIRKEIINKIIKNLILSLNN